MHVLVTGGKGFIGSALVRKLCLRPDFCVRATSRETVRADSGGSVTFGVGELNSDTDWHAALFNVNVVVHTAARAHVLNDTMDNQLSEFRRINVDGTLNLARQAVETGVKKFIFLSSIGVNGAHTFLEPFNEKTPPRPHADYAISKLEAEVGLSDVLKGSSTELVIIRPPLVYGPNAPGNFGRLLRLIAKETTLPLGGIRNQRNFVAMDNFLDFVLTCIEHPCSGGQIFCVADKEPISTPKLIRLLAEGMGKKATLVNVPPRLLRVGAKLLGRMPTYHQLCSSLQIDITKARTLLNWTPPVSVDEALRKTARHFLEVKS